MVKDFNTFCLAKTEGDRYNHIIAHFSQEFFFPQLAEQIWQFWLFLNTFMIVCVNWDLALANS